MFERVDRDYVWTYPLAFDQPIAGAAAAPSPPWVGSRPITIYVHIPFCRTDCRFCVFYREPYSALLVDAYVRALVAEISFYSHISTLRGRPVSAVYFGGGTASLLSEHELESVLLAIAGQFNLAPGCEVTMECHPSFVSPHYLDSIHHLGVNRLSFGAQSFNARSLRTLGLPQTARVTLAALDAARRAGFNNIAVDLMYRLPEQSVSELERELVSATSAGVSALSCYSLEIEGTRLAGLAQPDERIDQEMFYFIGDWAESHGMRRFAQPDFCIPGRECQYVLGLWGSPQASNLAFGAGALSGELNGYTYCNVSDVGEYIRVIGENCLPVLAGQLIDCAEAMARFCVLGVRCLSLDLQGFRSCFEVDLLAQHSRVVADLCAGDMMSLDDRSLRLTRRGLYFVDNISKLFYADTSRGKSVPWGWFMRDARPSEYFSASSLRE